LQLVFGNADRLRHAAQRVFSDHAVALAAQQQAQGGRVGLALELLVHQRQVEIELASVFGLELAGLEFDDQKPVQPVVLEQQVDVEGLAVHLDRHLPASKGETLAQFHQHPGDVAGHGGFDVALLCLGGQAQEVEQVRFLERLLHQFAVRRRQALREVADGLPGARLQPGRDVVPHHVA
jgi:hypothetical protein